MRVEFTIEPFVEGRPGPHVTAAIEAVRSHGADVEVGPFGTSCTVDDDAAVAIVQAVTAAALDNGATHITLSVDRTD